MKKLLKLLIVLLFTSCMYGQTNYAYQLVNTFSATGSQPVNITGSGAAFHKLTWSGAGTVSTCSIRVDSSSDGVTYNVGDVIAAQTCTSNSTFTSTSFVANYVRINLVTLTGGGTLTANLTGYINNPSGGTSTAPFWVTPWGGNTSLASPTANTTKVFAFVLPASVTSTKLGYKIFTADNTGNLYDFGIYDTTGALLCHIGATAGTTFAPSTGDKSIAWLSSCSLTGNTKYFVALTGNGATVAYSGALSAGSPQCNVNPTANNTTSGGVLNASGLTYPADANSTCGIPNFSLLP